MSEFKPTTVLSFTREWIAPTTLLFFKDDTAPENLSITTYGFNSNEFGASTIFNAATLAYPLGFFNPKVGQPYTWNYNTPVYPTSSHQTAYGNNHYIINSSRELYPRGMFSSRFGLSTAYNSRQYVRAFGIDSASYGIAYMIGGVRWLTPSGYTALAAGKALVVNTTANQGIKLVAGIAPPYTPAPLVQPYTTFASGWLSGRVGAPVLIPTPVIRFKGFASSSFSEPTIWFRVRKLSPIVIARGEFGYADIRDPTRFIQPSALVTSALFGDVYTKNKKHFIRQIGINELVVSDWSIFSNRNRHLYPKAWLSQAFGVTEPFNKSPSISPKGMDAPLLGDIGIGNLIRYLKPTGFDRMLLGKPEFINTPELTPASINSMVFGRAWSSHKVRDITPKGYMVTTYGAQLVWYKYRIVQAVGWRSEDMYWNKHTLTHGVRELIASGSSHLLISWPWISQGTRALEPKSIYTNRPSNHSVGRSQEVKAEGFIATLFGTRIIPINQAVYPQGFAGLWGLTTAYLQTQYISPLGYISVGQQPADRWGYPKFYNLVQYVVQDYDVKNGLVPPAWPDWTLIENRVKQSNITGFDSQKFGYSRVDNNAAPLLPPGIEPPVGTRFDVSFIGHAIRPLVLSGIYPAGMGSWSVVYNDARVVTPVGLCHTQSDKPAIANTRRYYGGIEGIDSLSVGVGMIAYRIREVDIESWHSIAPPRIELSYIGLYTRYVSFNGYETAAYGTPSLSIHFRIIAPKWAHRDKTGSPAVKNLTPELGVYGHNSEEFGGNNIRTQWRNIYAYGENTAIFGAHKIADSKQRVEIRGWHDTYYGNAHEVIRLGSPPYGEQRIDLDGWFDYKSGKYVGGHGFEYDELLNNKQKRIPSPLVNQNILYAQGRLSSDFGTTKVSSNVIHVEFGYAVHSVSNNLTVSNKITNISLTAEDKVNSAVVFGKPALTPQTIWAVAEAPEQAKRNHTLHNYHYVGGVNGSYYIGFKLGTPSIESTIRTVRPRYVSVDAHGDARIENRTKQARLKGFSSYGLGIPSIPFTRQDIAIFTNQPPMSAYGEPSLHIPDTGTKTLSVNGFALSQFGWQVVSNWIRTVGTLGFSSMVMGTSKYNDTPYTWQGLRVGELVPVITKGYDAAVYGNAGISLFIRQLELTGFESLDMQSDTSHFEKRMKVALIKTPGQTLQTVNVDGVLALNTGNLTIKLNQRFITPDGNSDQFRKGGYHA